MQSNDLHNGIRCDVSGTGGNGKVVCKEATCKGKCDGRADVHYRWVEVNDSLHVYNRTSFLRDFPKEGWPNMQILAYVRLIANTKQYRALNSDCKEMDIPYGTLNDIKLAVAGHLSKERLHFKD